MTALAECRKGRVRRGYVARSASRMALLVGALVAFGAGVAGAAPLGTITEFANPGSNDAQVRGRPGRKPVVHRSGRKDRPDHHGWDDHRVQQRPERRVHAVLDRGGRRTATSGSPTRGTTPAIGMINPTTHAITEFAPA